MLYGTAELPRHGPHLETKSPHSLSHACTGQIEPRRQPLKGHAETVLCLRFSPDSFILASGSDDKTVRVGSTRVYLGGRVRLGRRRFELR